MNRHKVAVVLCALLAVAIVGAGLYVFTRRDSSNLTHKVIGGGGGGDANAISIYAPNELSKVLERVTTAFQQEHPGTTFQFTLGPSSDLAKRIQEGQKPNIYVDVAGGIGLVSAKVRPIAPPVPFGTDILQLAVPTGNPKRVGDLGAFASGSPFTTGICAPELPCGRAGAQSLQRAGVNAAPRVVASNVSQLTDGVSRGRIDAVLLLRTQLRSVLTGINTPQIPPQSTIRIDYQMVQYPSGGASAEFISWLQGSPSARKALRDTGMLSYYEP